MKKYEHHLPFIHSSTEEERQIKNSVINPSNPKTALFPKAVF